MNIKLTVESERVLKEMGSVSTHGRTRIDLSGEGNHEELTKQKTYWFMPYVFEETKIPHDFMVHELPESITKQIMEFINR